MATAAGFKTPEMNWDATDLRDELAKFKQYCDLIFSRPYSKKLPKEQATFILLWIGRQGLETYNSWTWAEAEDSTNPAKIWERFEKHVVLKVNHRLARYQLQQLRQKNDEFVDVFLTRCRNQAMRSRFRDNDKMDERLIEQLIVGTKHKKVQERLLEKGEQLTLDEAIDIARTYEATQSQMEELDGESNKDIRGINENESENKAKDELDDMESRGIITKLKEGKPTAWVNSLVYRRKSNGKLRICLDPKDLNKAISREHHVIPTLEEILPKLSGAKYFSIVDAKCGYWNVELDQESSYLTTFNSPFGRYRFLRMPFGLRMSQDVFQAKIDQTFEDCEGTIGIADDIVIFGKSEQEHDNHLNGMLTRCRNTGLKLNPDKCKIKQKKIKLYAVTCGEDGVQPDPSKVSALKQMAPPTNKRELQAFLGLATYMGPFTSDLSTLTAPLPELVKENSLFDWNSTHQQAFDAIKNAINAEAALAYHDPTKEVTLQVDASSTGLGAALLQDKKPIAFASKALTDTESRYANIEQELLAVVYGCERFHTYLYGQSFIAESDHKPLEAIQLKNLMSAPPRLQRMLLRLQPYDVTIKYRPGKQVLVADALSRLSPEEEITIPDLNVEIHDVCPQFSSECLQRI